MDKKGQLKENTLGVIIAVIGIVIVFGGAGFLLYNYFTLSSEQRQEEAKGLLDVLGAKLEKLEEGKNSSFLVKGPCEGNSLGDLCYWYLTGWSVGEQDRPQRCFFNSCICVCKAENKESSINKRELVEACQNGETGYCKAVSTEKIEVSSVQKVDGDIIAYKEGFDVRGPKKDAVKPFISFRTNLIELMLQRNPGGLNISRV
ncbi:hypothetical protein FJZ18_02735 [Candidatus Pacearchaeota archaeon]|nr:hypothetical protein [Candidatus Pacearchaeota archaeon]